MSEDLRPPSNDSAASDTIHPLDVALLEGHKIRLIELLPGRPDDKIAIKLSICDLDTAPSYEALSYVWGEAANQTIVQCHNRARKITGSLHAALRRIRLPKKSRFVWADAICINQKDPVEKSHHVGFMDRVYAKATRVLVFMGEAVETEANDVVSLLDEHVKRMGRTKLSEMPVLAADDPLFRDPRWKSLGTLTRNPWFGRAWVIQEVGKASQPIVLYGTAEFCYRTLMQLARWIVRCASQLRAAGVYLLTIHTDWEHWTAEWRKGVEYDYTLIDLLSHAKGLGCSVKHDHVYSLLGHPLARTAEDEPIVKPDYTAMAGDVFWKLSMYMLSELGLKCLSAVEHTEKSIEDALPSWVARWDMDVIWNSFGYFPDFYYRASGPEPDELLTLWKPTLSSSAPELLSVRAKELDTVDAVFAFPLRPEPEKELEWDLGTARELVEHGHRLIKVLLAIYEYLTIRLQPHKVQDAFSLTLCAGLKNYLEAEETLAAHRADFRAFWQLIAPDEALLDASPPTEPAGDPNAFWGDLLLSGKGRSFFTTEKGFCGLGPLYARQGDVCYVFKSARVPFVVRPRQDGRSRLLGEAYVHGFMRGELMEQAEGAVEWTSLDLY